MAFNQELMPRRFSDILAAITCLLTWLAFALAMWLSTGFAEKSGSVIEWVAFAAPVVFFVVPFVFDALQRRSFMHATWLLAAAPILGLTNVFAAILLTIIFVKFFGRNDLNYLIAIFIVVIIWTPLLRRFFKHEAAFK